MGLESAVKFLDGGRALVACAGLVACAATVQAAPMAVAMICLAPSSVSAFFSVTCASVGLPAAAITAAVAMPTSHFIA